MKNYYRLFLSFILGVLVITQTSVKAQGRGKRNLKLSQCTIEKEIFNGKNHLFNAREIERRPALTSGEDKNIPYGFKADEIGKHSNPFSNQSTESNFSFYKMQNGGDMLDSIIYAYVGLFETQPHFVKESFSHNVNGQLIKYLYQIKDTLSNGWLNYNCYTYGYDKNGYLNNELFESWYADSSVWQKNRQTIYTNDDNGNILTEVHKRSYGNDSLIVTDRVSNYYNSNGDIILTLSEVWDENNNQWINSGKASYTYDSGGNLLEEKAEIWNSDNQNWENYKRYIYEYDENGNMLLKTKEVWSADSLNQEWIVTYRDSCTYDSNGNLLTLVNESVGLWDIILKYTHRDSFTYDSDGNRLGYLYETWNSDSSKWENYSDTHYSYDVDKNLQSKEIRIWNKDTRQWEKDFRISYTYDAQGKQQSKNSYTWNKDINDWEVFMRYGYEYNTAAALTHFHCERTDGSGWVPTNGILNFSYNGYFQDYSCADFNAYYGPLTSIRQENDNIVYSFSLSNNYPNPFNPITTISYSIPEKSNVELAVYNALGQKVAVLVNEEQQPGVYKIGFKASGLASGLYFYKLKTDKAVAVKKMLLLK